MRYYAFGGTRLSTGNMFTDRLFTGQRWIADLGIYHYNARFYSPTLGRFLSADTMMSGLANPRNLNPFSYAANNPLRYTDPTGHMICEVCGGEGGDFPNGYGYYPPPPSGSSSGSSSSSGSTSSGSSDSGGGSTGGSSGGSSGDAGSGGSGVPAMTNPSDDGSNTDIVDFLYDAATVSQNIATLIDIPFAITEVIFIVGECISAPLVGCATGAFMGEAAFNLTGANALETAFSGASLALTFTADLMDDGKLGEATSTSFVTFLAGGVMLDPIGDVIIDGYASGYSNGVFNGIDTLMNGGPLVIPK